MNYKETVLKDSNNIPLMPVTTEHQVLMEDQSTLNVTLKKLLPKDNPEATGSFSLGRKENSTVGNNSFAAGSEVIASNNYSHAEGFNSVASGEVSHAEGNRTTASAESSHAEGRGTTASGLFSHAEGSNGEAYGFASHVEGSLTKADEEDAHAEGYSSMAEAKFSHAEGFHTIAIGECQHVQGKYNIEDENMLHIVGNGQEYGQESNAHTLDWDGNAWFAGNIYVGSTSGTNKDNGSVKVATENDLDARIVSLTQSEYNALSAKNPKTLYLIVED